MAENVADLTLAHVRNIDRTVANIWEVVQRHDARMGRLERDVGEIKSDMILMENRILSRMNEILQLRERVDDHDRRLQSLEQPV